MLKSILSLDNRDIPNLRGVKLTARSIVSENLHHTPKFSSDQQQDFHGNF